jgi:hypothetical protein
MSALTSGPTVEEKITKGGTFTAENWQGEEVKVFLRMIPTRSYVEYAKVSDNPESAVDFLAEKPGLSETLSPDSVINLWREGERLNRGFLRFIEHNRERLEIAMPGVSQSR